MADFAASILAPTVDRAIKYVGAVIKRQFIYLCCFNGNISGLEGEAVKLDNAIEGLRARVEAATNNVEDIDPEVSFWLSGSDNIKEETTRILNEARNVESGCLRVAARFSLSRKAVKTAATMVQQRENCIFSNISLPPRIAAARGIPLTNAFEFESRKEFEEDIMTTLRDNKVKMIGICGMGGLGKTTMAKRIMNRALEEHVFDEVVMAVVSQQADESKIQLEIGGSLGLKLKDEPWQVRIQKLNDRLVGTKKILLVLDDVWESLNLNDLGIPCGDESKGCTILITSRNNNALSAMDVMEVFVMKSLSEEDAWFLFRKKAAPCVDDTKLNSTAKQVARECKGLPIALATVGAALKNEKDPRGWKNALRQLREPNPNDTPEFITQVYNPIMVSYNQLNPEEAKSLLLCCLFPEDFDISIDHLTCICMGLRPIEDMWSLEEERARMWTMVKSLKSRSLLLDSEEEDCVKMHDVARDVCVFIAKKKGYIGGNGCIWVSSSVERIELPAPNLNLFLLMGSSSKRSESLREFKIHDTFFEGFRELKVLSIEEYDLTSLPKTTQSLKNLRTLCLYSCGMETISFVGDLVNLEILICTFCHSLKELPPEMKGLNRLKVLDLSWCLSLRRIGRGIISSLVGLEELKMLESFNDWEGDYGEGQNAAVKELELLTNLTCLEIHIANPGVVDQHLQISSKLERHDIRITSNSYHTTGGCNKNLTLQWGFETKLEDWTEMQLLRDTESLHLSGYGACELDHKKLQNIRRLSLKEFRSVENIVFPLIEYLHLDHLLSQEEIWDAPISLNSFPNFRVLVLTMLVDLEQLLSIPVTSLRENSYVSLFTNLSSIVISDCYSLHNLGQFPNAGKDCLSQLKYLKIKECSKMKQVFFWSEGDQHESNSDPITKILFPKLKTLHLENLRRLITFCEGIDGLEFPLLAEIRILGCREMRSMCSRTSLNGNGSDHNISGEAINADDDHHHHLFCQLADVSTGSSLKEIETDRNPFCAHIIDASSYHGLLRLKIYNYYDGRSLCTSLVAENLASLRELYIGHCENMVQVIKDGTEKAARRHRLFPNLQTLTLKRIRNLVSFCEGDVELPSLTYVNVEECYKMANFTLGSLIAPNWEAFETDLNNHLVLGVNVYLGKMKKVAFKSFEFPLCRYKINPSLFKGLDQLSIKRCGGLMSLFTSTIAGNLVNLRKLEVSSCYSMQKVIEDEEGEGEGEEKKVANHQIFRNMQELSLDSLRSLRAFWDWKGNVEWPSLRQLDISHCPYLASMTLGPLATPKLASFCIDSYQFGATNDVNGMLQQRNSSAV